MNIRPTSWRRPSWRTAAALTAATLTLGSAIGLRVTGTWPDESSHTIAIGTAADTTVCPGSITNPVLPGVSVGGPTIVLPGSGTTTCTGSLTPQLGGASPSAGIGVDPCQLTDAELQVLQQQAAEEEAAAQDLFQKLLLQNLLKQAGLKAATAVNTAAGSTGRLSVQQVTDLITNGTLNPADAAAALIETMQQIEEQTRGSGTTTSGTTCQAYQDDQAQTAKNAASPGTDGGTDSSNGGASGSDDGSTGDVPGTNVPADPLEAAADRNVDLSKITPKEIVWRTDNDTLWRVDDRSPDQIWPDGFQPKDVNGDYDLNDHVGPNPDSPFVSTTKSTDWAGRYPWFYEIEAPGGIDLAASSGVSENVGEDEVVFPGGIDTRYIVGAQQYDRSDNPIGDFIPNPNYGK